MNNPGSSAPLALAPWPWRLLRAFCLFLALMHSPMAAALTLVVEELAHPAFSVARLEMEATDQAVLRLQDVRLLERKFPLVTVRCARFIWLEKGFDCQGGMVEGLGSKTPLPLRLLVSQGRVEAELAFGNGERWRIERDAAGAVRSEIIQGNVERLAFLLENSGWKLAGKLNGRVDFDGQTLAARLQVTGGGFSDAGGLHAGEKLAGEIRLNARQTGGAWHWQADARWQGGEFLWQPLYAAASGQTLRAQGRLDEKRLTVQTMRLNLPEIGQVAGAGVWQRAGWRREALQLSAAGLDMTRGAESFLAPFFAAQGVPDATLRGKLSFSAVWDNKGLEAATAGFNDVALRAKDGRFLLAGMHGGLPWLRDQESQGYLEVGAARVGDIKLGAFRLPLVTGPDRFAVARSEIPFLGSQLILEHLLWRRPSAEAGWEGDLSLSLLPTALPELTQALGLPKMAGVFSASFPHLRYRDGAAFLDGALVIQVFEGYLSCTDLRLDNPFGPLPRLTANVDARQINLGQLTETFSFGRITGYADADIQGLVMEGWRSRRFDARIVSSPGDYRRRISQRAVQNISSLGGAGAGAAIQRSLLSFFDEFGYKRIGLSCRLRDNICEMGGVDEKPEGYVMVEGGGVPALTVVGYNRRVDWPVLVKRLQDIVHNNVKPEIR